MKEKTGFLSFAPRVNLEDFLYLLVLLFLPTQFGKHFWPNFSYVAGVRVDYLSPTLYVTDFLILALLILVFTKSFKSGFWKILKKHRTLLLHLGVIFIFLLTNSILSKNIYAAFYGMLKFYEFVFFGILTFYKVGKIKKDLLLVTIGISVIFQSALAIFQYKSQSSLGGLFYFFGERSFSGETPGVSNISAGGELILRAYGTFSHPNVLSGFLLIFLTLLLFNLNMKKLSHSIITCAIILGSIALFLTFSRIAILLFILSILVFIFSKVKIKLGYKLAIAGIISISIFLSSLFFTPFYLRFIGSSLFEESFIIREELLFAGVQVFLKNPIIGAGLNNYFSNFEVLGSVFVLQPVHNIFALTLIQTGLIGFFYSLLFTCKILLKVFREKPVYLKLIFLYVILIGFFDHYFLTLQQGQLLLSFLIGFILGQDD